MLEITEGVIINGQPRKTDNIGYIIRRKTRHNTMYVLDTTIPKQTQIT